MSEHKRLERIRHFGVSLSIFNKNYDELHHHLTIHNTPRISLALMGQEKRHLLHAYQIEITRFLHNYIASSLSLVDHTRNHYRELYGNNDLFPDYQVQIDIRFKNHPLSVFIKDLRQYLQHYQMPGLSSRLVYKKDAPDFEMTIRMGVADLNKFSGWKSKSKEYISSFEDDIDLMSLVKEYHEHVNEFYQWFIGRQMEIHKDDIEKVDLHKKKIRDNEFMRFVSELITQPKSIEDFEHDLFKFYDEDELEFIRNSQSTGERIKNILTILQNEALFNEEAEKAVKNVYK